MTAHCAANDTADDLRNYTTRGDTYREMSENYVGGATRAPIW